MYKRQILFHSAIYLFFIIVPFRKAFRFRPAVTVTAIAAFVAVVAAIILLFLESEAPFVQYAPQGGAFLMAISLFTGIILIRGNPMRIFYSVLVVINIQNCATVSYTHLDVYKRQEPFRVSGFVRLALGQR